MARRMLVVAVAMAAVVACDKGAPPSETPGGSGDPAAPAEPTTPAPTEAAPSAAATGSGGAPRAALGNPASKHCIDQGGELTIVDQPAGQVGVCTFKDGSRCEEWAYFRGQCAPGQCRQELGDCAKRAP